MPLRRQLGLYSPKAMVSVTISPALSADNPQTIRAYFEKVRQLVKSGVQYPVDLDEVWPLVYSRKNDAVRFLKADFAQDFDYQAIRKKSQLKVGTTAQVDYSISVGCMEWLIARKIRPVFEVYREVFHRVIELAEQVYDAKMEALVNLNNSLTKRVIALESIVNRMDKAQTTYFNAKVKDEATKYDQDTLVRRTRIMSMISMKIRCSGHLKWADYWTSFEKAYDINVYALPQKPGEHWLDTAIRHGHLEKIEELLGWQ